ncbi:hypothetical protein PEC18_00270 [Paucibacter sp. O1-1]|nr:hypothetical protein [Paucibacter sp. O1-1]MDA3824353.1 hypothetical protein [Paucibacter sp. O1-1]
MTVRSTLLTAATAAVALLGAATCQAATTTDWHPAGEGEVIQHDQPLRSTLSRAQVVAQVGSRPCASTRWPPPASW